MHPDDSGTCGEITGKPAVENAAGLISVNLWNDYIFCVSVGLIRELLCDNPCSREFSETDGAGLAKLAVIAKDVGGLCMFHGTFFNHGLINIRSGKSGETVHPVGSEEPFCKIVFLRFT